MPVSSHRRRASEVDAVPEFGPHMDEIQLAPPQHALSSQAFGTVVVLLHATVGGSVVHVHKSGSYSVSKSASMSCCTRQRWGKPPVARCSSKTCPTSGVRCYSTTWNGLCSRSWDRARASKWARERFGMALARGQAQTTTYFQVRYTLWPAFRRGRSAISEEGARGGRAGRGVRTSDGVISTTKVHRALLQQI